MEIFPGKIQPSAWEVRTKTTIESLTSCLEDAEQSSTYREGFANVHGIHPQDISAPANDQDRQLDPGPKTSDDYVRRDPEECIA